MIASDESLCFCSPGRFLLPWVASRMSAVLAGGEAARIVLVVDTVSSILFDKPASEKAGRGRCRWHTFLSWGLLKFAGIGFVPRYTQQRIAAGSARKFRPSTGSVLKSTGVENCMVEGCDDLWQFHLSCQSPWTVISAVNPIILYYKCSFQSWKVHAIWNGSLNDDTLSWKCKSLTLWTHNKSDLKYISSIWLKDLY